MKNTTQDLNAQIKARAASLGFDLCGITTPEPLAEYQRYADWLANGYHAGMAYLDTDYHKSVRKDPRQLFPVVRSIIVLGKPYRLSTRQEMEQREAGLICGYACGEDYHHSLPRELEPLVEDLLSLSPSKTRPRVFTDSAPILERELAARAGLGWIGKNSCLISPSHGSAFLLAEVLTDVTIEPDTPLIPDRCGTCDRCIKACPTGCILPGRLIDANRCISYHTIENKGEIPPELTGSFTNQVFGCDICQVVCPWNRDTTPLNTSPNSEKLIPVAELDGLLEINKESFDQRFGSTPVSRVKREGFIRNVHLIRGKLQSSSTDKPKMD